MMAKNPRRTALVGERRWFVHPFFVSIGGSLLIAAFASDVMYSQTSLVQWSNASEWLIAVGLLLALVAALVLLVEVLVRRGMSISWLDFILLSAAALVSLLNAFVHSRDAWSSVVPLGIWLSAIAALLLLIVGLRGWSAASDTLDRGGNEG